MSNKCDSTVTCSSVVLINQIDNDKLDNDVLDKQEISKRAALGYCLMWIANRTPAYRELTRKAVGNYLNIRRGA